MTFDSDGDDDRPANQTDQLLMTVEPNADLESGDTVEIVLDREQIHLFDAATGDAVAHGLKAGDEALPGVNEA